MVKVKVDGKVTPEAFQILLLDEISGKLGVMLEKMEEAEAGGMIAPLNLAVTPTLIEYTCTPPWYSFTLFNGGPNPVFFDVNRDANAMGLTTPLNMGENIAVDFEKPKIEFLYLRCAPGQTANIRIFATW